MTQVVQDFLWAQKVQEPIALFSDWLHVGHVDEFMSFVPAPDRKVNSYRNTEIVKIQEDQETFSCYWPMWKCCNLHGGIV